ncbi:ABC-2 family transporter protein [Streptomyces sp. ME02-8801-2C]|uniref:ABC transporter permease n=1 Tax=Streptomyces sp. ME02-8801-2C TaxID=3028680 RepID=UPI0029B6767B|nr:ABC-2 family transporter protein [Streptomyces sp. ME02-8801-2C]MDX3458205.1 ABC-2 family transporter protein [Streptomyces sp. ME02-8801-2C]
MNFRALMEYRTNFLLSIAIGAVWQVSVIVFAGVLLVRFSGVGGWASSDVLLIAGLRMLAHGLYVLFFGRVFNLKFLVQEGLVEAYLVRPMPVYRQVQLAFFPANALGDLIVAISLFAAAISRSQHEWTVARILFLAGAVVGGMFMESAIFTAISSAALHFPATSYWSTWFEELMGTFGNYPLSILPKIAQVVFTCAVPLAFVAYFPAAILTGHGGTLGVPVWLAVASPLLGLLAFIASRLLWNRSLSHFTGTNH